MDRPEARNALSRRMIAEIRAAVGRADADEEVAALVLTGADPAFCAGLDLKELGKDGGVLNDPPPTRRHRHGEGTADDVDAGRPDPGARGRRTLLDTDKPIVGAVNGSAVTGGLELALNCDFLVASERARFADTHARIGVQPLWGLTVLLPEAVGLRRAREMSATGNFVDAVTAERWGLVNHVVAHGELLPRALAIAGDVATTDPGALRTLLDTYRRGTLVSRAEAWRIEAEAAAAFHGGAVDPGEIERRRQAVVDRGRSQV
ncbi:MAG: enoyl-CoA hydratase [Acidobacteriota bacterium]|nr:enoyl-CoA hydratase [Acidobacteriota bacterium]